MRFYLPTLAALLTFSGIPSQAEVYKWVDQDGRVHYGDKRHAKANNIRMGDASYSLDESGRTLTLHAIADAELREGTAQRRGALPKLATGVQGYRNSTRQIRSLVKFDSSVLLGLLQKSKKRIASASLELSLVEQKNRTAHRNVDDAFFVIPSHNRWDEAEVNWQLYYDKQTVPYPIRKLPFMTAQSSHSVSDNRYQMDAMPLVQALVDNNMRELTLEIKLQRISTATEIQFHARESGLETSPKLRIEFIDAE